MMNYIFIIRKALGGIFKGDFFLSVETIGLFVPQKTWA